MQMSDIKERIETRYEVEEEFSADYDYAGQMSAATCSHLTNME